MTLCQNIFYFETNALLLYDHIRVETTENFEDERNKNV
jgi:hypothetical protein